MQLENGAFVAMKAAQSAKGTMSGLQAMHLVFPSSELATRNALGEVMHALGPLGLDADQKGSLEILLAEALNNIVEHAYPEDSPGIIEMRCEKRGDRLRFTFLDHGLALINGIPEGLPADLGTSIEHLPEGGFGWFLIRELSETVTYLRKEDRNHLSLTFPLDRAPGDA